MIEKIEDHRNGSHHQDEYHHGVFNIFHGAIP
jgi:hypothetical protein